MSLELPVVVSLSGLVFPKARITQINVIERSFAFDWLNAGGSKVDSGGSVARLEGEEPEEPTEADLIAGIVAAAGAFQPPRIQSGRTVALRLTDAEATALNASTNPDVIRFRMAALAAGEVSEADPAFDGAKQLLNALGIIATSRWAALLAP